jgi:7,8-dihydropterin-6-yl-methyl-4-(beta-D-ribofuranosyl)aminobenzene 5'-phosphate synthase
MDEAAAEAIRKAAKAVVWTSKPTEVLEGIFVTGEIPRRNTFEDTGGRFFLDATCARPDPLLDDQALFFDTTEGLVVLLGCGHAGVVNTLEYVQRLTGGRPIHAILGGLHLLTASPERMEKTIAAFRRLDIQRQAPAHCTGLPALAQLWTALPGRCCSCAVGTRLSFQMYQV